MASIVLKATDRFPATTSVSAYAMPAGGLIPKAIAPPGAFGSAIATASVAADGTLTLTGLNDDTVYVAYALVNSEHRYVGFRTPPLSGLAVKSGENAIVGSSGGSVGFFGTTGSTRPAAYTQTYSTAARTHPAVTAAALVTTAATSTTPFGYTTQAQADAIVTQGNANRADILALKNLVNSLIDDLQALGLAQ